MASPWAGPTTAQLKHMLDAEGRLNPATAGPAEIHACETLVAQTRQAELKQAVSQVSAAEKVSENSSGVKPETETSDGLYTGDRDPEWCPALGSSVHIHIGKQIGEAVDTRTSWQVVGIGRLEKAGKF